MPSVRVSRSMFTRHWLFLLLCVPAVVMRVLDQLAYWPTIIYPDSEYYLGYAANWTRPGDSRPTGYSLFLRLLHPLHSLGFVVAVQHAIGIATAVLVYVLLVRFGTRRWLAALATVPVLLDPLQLIFEQYLLSDVLFVFMILVGLTLLMWRRRPVGPWLAALAGLVLAFAVWVRYDAILALVPAALFVLLSQQSWRRRVVRTVAFGGVALLPIVGYLLWYHAQRGVWGFSSYSGRFLYGRVAPFANCQGLALPSYERPLCPTQPVALRTQDHYMWSLKSPQWTFKPPPGKTANQVLHDFDLRIIKHQPLTYARVAAADLVYGFSGVRGLGPDKETVWYFQFQPFYPHNLADAATWVAFYQGHGRAGVNRPLARVMSDYGQAYVPGPVFAVLLLVALLAALGLGWARRSGLRLRIGLVLTTVLLLLAGPAFTSVFSWRYQLPQLALLPLAGLLGFTALSRSGPGEGRKVQRPDATVQLPTDGHHRLPAEPDPTTPAAVPTE